MTRDDEAVRAAVTDIPGALFWAASADRYPLEKVSPGIEALTGYPPAAFLTGAASLPALILEPDRWVEAEVASAVRQGRPYSVDYRIHRADGSIATVSECAAACAPGAAERRIFGFVVESARPPRPRRTWPAAPSAASPPALAAIPGARDLDLGAVLVHELSQPLMAALGWHGVARAQLNRTGEPCPALSDSLSAAASTLGEATHLLAAYRRLLGGSGLRLFREDLAELVGHVVQSFGETFAASGVELDVDVPPVCVLVDAPLIRQVLVNLLRNSVQALRHVRERAISVRAVADGSMVRLSVSDTGPGFSDAQPVAPFRPTASVKPGRMGLGLALCSFILEAHGGTLAASANAPRGATLVASLPRA